MPRSRHRKNGKPRRHRAHSAETKRRRRNHQQILDTSAVNALFDDPRRDELIEALRDKMILPTNLSISELAATPDPVRRQALLSLLKTLGGETRPLLSPNQIIIQACQSYARRDRSITLNRGDEVRGGWIALVDPAQIDAEGQRLAREHNEEQEARFREMHERMRNDLQPAFREELARPRTLSALVRIYNNSENLLYGVVNSIYERGVGRPLRRGELRPLLGSIPQWHMFLIGYACAVFQRAVREQGFGHRNNPGNMDLWSATYLPSCDCFVTNDTRQRRALKVISKYNPPLVRIVSYKEWSEKLLHA
jgi:hypothetical protein